MHPTNHVQDLIDESKPYDSPSGSTGTHVEALHVEKTMEHLRTLLVKEGLTVLSVVDIDTEFISLEGKALVRVEATWSRQSVSA